MERGSCRNFRKLFTHTSQRLLEFHAQGMNQKPGDGWYCWRLGNPANQLRLVVFSPLFLGFHTSRGAGRVSEPSAVSVSLPDKRWCFKYSCSLRSCVATIKMVSKCLEYFGIWLHPLIPYDSENSGQFTALPSSSKPGPRCAPPTRLNLMAFLEEMPVEMFFPHG